jgi:erythromycin esterase
MVTRRGILLGASAVAGAFALQAALYWPKPPDIGTGPTVDEAVIDWLKAHTLPLASVEPGSGIEDLAQLRSVIGDARVVGLGGATHGTREFFQLKHRIIKYCVSELGFTLIGFDENYGAALTVNDYVLHGKGNAADAVTGMGFWVSDTEEVVSLVEWVRAWNDSHERKVKFYGLDMQAGQAPALHLLAYLERVAPELAAASERILGRLCSRYAGTPSRMPVAVRNRISAQIKVVLDAFAAKRAPWISQSSELDWGLARQCAVVLGQCMKFDVLFRLEDQDKAVSFQGRCMADNVRALLDIEGPGAKALLWTHNGQVQRKNLFEWVTMGNVLSTELGADYRAVGLAFHQGGFRAMGPDDEVRDYAVGTAPADTLDGVLAAAGIPLFALDLKGVPADGPVASWMARKPSQRYIPEAFDPRQETDFALAADPRDTFDALVFVEATTPSRGLKHTPRAVPLSPAAVTKSNSEPTNLAFGNGTGTPNGWQVVDSSHHRFEIALVDGVSPKGSRALRIARASSPLPWGDAALTQSFPAAPWRGRRLVLSAAMRADAPRIGTGAQLLVHVWPKKGMGATGNSTLIVAAQADGLLRSADWVRRSVAIDIPADAERLQISLAVTGTVAGWFGDVALESEAVATASSSMPTAAQPSRAAAVPMLAQLRRRIG